MTTRLVTVCPCVGVLSGGRLVKSLPGRAWSGGAREPWHTCFVLLPRLNSPAVVSHKSAKLRSGVEILPSAAACLLAAIEYAALPPRHPPALLQVRTYEKGE